MCVALQATTSSHAVALIVERWSESVRTVASVRDLVVLLAVTNSRLGSVRSPAVGQLATVQGSFAGGGVHSFLSGQALCSPAALPGTRGGVPSTWRSPRGG